MFKFILKLFLLSLLSFSNFLYADGNDIGISISNASTNESSNTISFTISLTETPILPISVDYSTQNGSATAGSDYTAKSDYLLFGAGIASRTVTIDLLDDNIYEGNENFYINISSSATGYVVTNSQGVGTIIDNESQPLEISTANTTVNENDGTAQASFEVSLNQPAPTAGVTLSYVTRDGTALSGSDYSSQNTTLFIAQGEQQGTIQIPIIGDTLLESKETFYVDLSSPTQGTLTNTTVIGTINDDDEIKVDISSNDVNEGNVGDNNQMEFKIFLTKPYPPSQPPLTINYQTQDGSSPSATLNEDYIPQNGSVTFNSGDLEKIVYVSIIGDNDIEPDENVAMTISGSSYIINNSSESKILNDDGSYPSLSFDSTDFSTLEGNSSSKNLNFTFTLDKPALAGTSFQYYTQNKTAKTSNNDYTKIPTTTYHIPKGATIISIPVQIIGDTNIENDEYFYLKLKNEKKLNIRGHTAKGYILNDDGSFPTLSFNQTSYTTTEGNNGQHDINITLSLDQPALAGSYFKYYTSNSTAKTSDNDYVGISTTKHTFVGGETELIIPISIKGDTKIEKDERFYFKIKNAQDLKFGSTTKVPVYINNDDGNFPKASIEATQLNFSEGDFNNTQVTFTIKLDSPATEDGISVKYKTYDSSAKVIDNDYEQITPQTVTFNIGESEKTLYSVIYADTKVEPDEKYRIRLYSPHHLKLNYSKRQIYINIENDDQHSNDPFTCDNTMYISSSTKRTTGATGRMWLHKIDTTKSPFEFRVVEENGAAELYNATAYNPDDNYIYGLYHRELIQITKTGKINNLGTITGLPSLLDNRQLYAGAIYGGIYYVTGPGVAYDSVYKINLADNNVSTLTLSKNVSIQDFSFSPTGTYLYGVEDGGKLLKIDVATGEVTSIGEAHRGFQFDSSYSDINGRFFANDSNGHGFFEFDLSTGNMRFLSNSQPATYNDGANCINAPLVFNDYGDAPKSYGKARHDIANGVFLGNDVDHDIQPYYSVDAKGDDTNGTDDEDGVTLSDGSDLNGAYLDFNTNHELIVKASKPGYLNVWVDYNIDGDFDDANEHIFVAKSLVAGENHLNFTVPSNLTTNTQSYMRFRFSSTANLNATENAPDGEVEDYAVKFGSAYQPLRGKFNIERTDSESFPIMSDDRNAWYTQVTGRDFNYSIVFYEEDMSAEKELSDVTVKVELVDLDNNNSVLYTLNKYIDSNTPSTRINIMSATDLKSLPSTRNTAFRITYPVDVDNNIIQTNCMDNPSLCTNTTSTYAKDNFAIRPQNFDIDIADANTTLSSNPLRLAAGYDYNLSVIATQYPTTDHNATSGYDANFLGDITFATTGHCADASNGTVNTNFTDGQFNDLNFNHTNVGNYLLDFVDSTWTNVDAVKNQCIVNNSSVSIDPNSPSGCNIETISDVNLSFYPYQFKVDFSMNNLPNSGHDDFIYMSDINITEHNTSLQFKGSITAQNENNNTTTNFTQGCVATDVVLLPNAIVETEDGILAPNTSIQTSEQLNKTPTRVDVNLSRMARFNDEVLNNGQFKQLIDINAPVNIEASKFFDENNGTAFLDLRYNINKNLSRTINPVQIRFQDFAVNSPLASSNANGLLNPNFIPSGIQDLNNTSRNFYFAKVSPDKETYNKIHFATNPLIRTPLNIDIFCDKSIDYCNQTGVRSNTDSTGLSRVQNGWYISSNHNTNSDGVVQNLTASPSVNVNVTPDNNVSFTQGRNGLVTTAFTNCSSANDIVIVTIVPDTSLLYHDDPTRNGQPFYTVSCSDQNLSQMSGIGQSGNIIDNNITGERTNKIDW